MITYELVKQLKDDGFITDNCESRPFLINGQKEWLNVPTLSEIIEACGDRFKIIWRFQKKGFVVWGAKAKGLPLKVYGKTPEEAVANLWLKLNKKQNV